jgi:excisionase family DNA binding protein
MTGPLRDPQHLADLFGVSVTKVRRCAQSGEWPAVRIGKQWRFTDEQIAEIVARHTQPARPRPAAVAGQVTPMRTRQARGPQRRTA